MQENTKRKLFKAAAYFSDVSWSSILWFVQVGVLITIWVAQLAFQQEPKKNWKLWKKVELIFL